MGSSTPLPHFTPGKDPVPILQEVGCALGPVWTGGKSRPHRDSIPDLPAHSSVAVPTELPGTHTHIHTFIYIYMYIYIERERERLIERERERSIETSVSAFVIKRISSCKYTLLGVK